MVIRQSPTRGWVIKEASLKIFELIYEMQEISKARSQGITNTKTLRVEQAWYFLKREDK